MMTGNHWMFGGVMWIFWIAVLVGLFFFVRGIAQHKHIAQKPKDNALEVLKKIYAIGDIDKKEFEQKKKDLLA